MLRFSYLLLAVSLLIGCGGGGSSAPQTASRTIAVTWPERTRSNIEAPSSALSAEITLVGASVQGQDVQFVVNRDGRLERHTESYSVSQPVRVEQAATLRAKFYSQPNATGTLVATLQATFNSQQENIDLTNIVLDRTVASVSTVARQITIQEGTQQLEFTARDADGNLVAVSPGSAKWEIVGTTAALQLTADGLATPVSQGTATVRVLVDNVASEPVTVTVASTFSRVLRFSGQRDSIVLSGGSLTGAVPLHPQFTVEAVMKVQNTGYVWQQWRDGSMNEVLSIESTRQWMTLGTGAGTPNIYVAGDNLPTGTWVHIAWVYDGTEIRTYRDGQLLNSRTATTYAPVTTGQACSVGYNSTVPFETSQWTFTGDLATFRISSTARYVGSTYAPPSRPFAVDSETLMLVDPSNVEGSPTTWTLPGTQGLIAMFGSGRGTAPTWQAYVP